MPKTFIFLRHNIKYFKNLLAETSLTCLLARAHPGSGSGQTQCCMFTVEARKELERLTAIASHSSALLQSAPELRVLLQSQMSPGQELSKGVISS